MKKLTFRVTFESDIVLPASSNTEGKIDLLDFIAGSNFLGMVAQKYATFQNSFEVFHSGAVRFGDGHILKNDKTTYKMPLSIFKEKNDETQIFNQITGDLSTRTQVQQLRNGYITQELEQVFVEYTYTQKSAYDTAKRTSKEGQMYGYKALSKGSIWQFEVKIASTVSSEDEQRIIEILTSSNRLGKSKSAEYGKVKIAYVASEAVAPQKLPQGEAVLYCHSRLALVDEGGNPTLDLKYLGDGVEIVDAKTQIRTSTFTPYNGARQTKDYERLCINKGSVIVVKALNEAQLKEIQNGVGAFLSEGFGEILINPSFLMQEKFEFKKEPKEEQKASSSTPSTLLGRFLDARQADQKSRLTMAKEVDEWAQKHASLYSNIKPSQWGNIRSICTSNTDDYQAQIVDYVSKGTKKWEPTQIVLLQEAMQSVEFTKLLAIKMGKLAQKKGERNAK